MTTNLPDLLKKYPGGEHALRSAMATQGRPVSRQLVRLWFTGTTPSPAYLPDLARLLIPVGIPALDLYTAAGVPLPRDVFPEVHEPKREW
jgi:hypothetical protein